MKMSDFLDRLDAMYSLYGNIEIQVVNDDFELYDIKRITPVFTESQICILREKEREMYYVIEVEPLEEDVT